MKVSIIIPNWNGLEHLAPCLDSLNRQTFRQFETILVDNGSSDGSAAAVRENFPWVRLLELPANLGFAAANNRGLELAGGEFIVTLNNDTRAEPGWLEELVRVAEGHPAAGMVGSRTCAWDEPDRVDTLGGKICRDGMSRGAFRGHRFSTLGLPAVMEVLYPSPAAALYRRAMLEETGFFDEDFFAYAEDTDLGLRGRWLGWEALVATRAVVHHRYSATGGGFSPFKLYLVERNHYWVALKNFPWPWLGLVPFFTILRFWEQLQAIRQGEGSGREFGRSTQRWPIARALLRGTRDAWWGLPGMWRKRRALVRSRRISSRQMAALLYRHRLTFRELLDRTEPSGTGRQ